MCRYEAATRATIRTLRSACHGRDEREKVDGRCQRQHGGRSYKMTTRPTSRTRAKVDGTVKECEGATAFYWNSHSGPWGGTQLFHGFNTHGRQTLGGEVSERVGRWFFFFFFFTDGFLQKRREQPQPPRSLTPRPQFSSFCMTEQWKQNPWRGEMRTTVDGTGLLEGGGGVQWPTGGPSEIPREGQIFLWGQMERQNP